MGSQARTVLEIRESVLGANYSYILLDSGALTLRRLQGEVKVGGDFINAHGKRILTFSNTQELQVTGHLEKLIRLTEELAAEPTFLKAIKHIETPLTEFSESIQGKSWRLVLDSDELTSVQKFFLLAFFVSGVRCGGGQAAEVISELKGRPEHIFNSHSTAEELWAYRGLHCAGLTFAEVKQATAYLLWLSEVGERDEIIKPTAAAPLFPWCIGVISLQAAYDFTKTLIKEEHFSPTDETKTYQEAVDLRLTKSATQALKNRSISGGGAVRPGYPRSDDLFASSSQSEAVTKRIADLFEERLVKNRKKPLPTLHQGTDDLIQKHRYHTRISLLEAITPLISEGELSSEESEFLSKSYVADSTEALLLYAYCTGGFEQLQEFWRHMESRSSGSRMRRVGENSWFATHDSWRPPNSIQRRAGGWGLSNSDIFDLATYVALFESAEEEAGIPLSLRLELHGITDLDQPPVFDEPEW